MLDFKKREWIIDQLYKGTPVSVIAQAQSISRQAVYDIKHCYEREGLNALHGKSAGRPEYDLPFEIKQHIINLRKEGHGIRRIEGLLRLEGKYVPPNKIHRFLTKRRMIIPEPKKGRRKNYIRWERKHSNSLWQTDFCWVEKLGCWLCAWLDDHSRFVPAADYFTEATTDNVISLFEKATKKYGYPRQTLSDRGTQFYPNLGQTCRFLEHMEHKGVEHIFASVKKPTTCGKLERFWGTHNLERWNFSSLRKFMEYYNHERPHMSLDYLTPYEVYTRDKV
ncbi:DDE-type integrase/transposase/recombinase [Candidatus Woesearchaeota archaeon]|nr:DDE-type integrase/transposase/recombinase [Candidatus Woesearchaeota archaeon]